MYWTKEVWLMHHGILGQRWGKRNGPPYPLGAEDHSASEKKAGYRKSIAKGRKTDSRGKPSSKKSPSGQKPARKGLTDGKKRAIKIGAAVAVGCLAAYGGYRLSQSRVLDKDISLGENAVKNIVGSNKAGLAMYDLSSKPAAESNDHVSTIFDANKAKSIADALGLDTKDGPNTSLENAQLANPDYNPADNKWKFNCAHATISWCLNEIGVKCKALPMYGEFTDSGMTPSEVSRYFKGLDWGIERGSYNSLTINKSDSVDECRKQLSNYILSKTNGENAVGIWRARSGYGHFMGWKVENKQVSFFDPQVGRANCNRWFAGMASGAVDAGFDVARIDNVDINPKYLPKAITRA